MTAKSARETFVLAPGAPVDLSALDPRATPVGPQSKADGVAAMTGVHDELEHRQEALWAQGRAPGATSGRSDRVLVVLQGVDTSGKGGVVRSVGRLVSPQGLRVASFGRPTEAELEHHFLWRVRRQLPPVGVVAVFDRSHYEDVLVARVDRLVEPDVLERRVAEIATFEDELVANGVALVKVFLHISADEQRERLLARLDDPAKQWKYSPEDLRARSRWSEYQQVYADVLARCASTDAPWFVVPADRKWYRNWAVGALLADTLTALDPQVPPPDYDVAEQRRALLEADPLR